MVHLNGRCLTESTRKEYKQTLSPPSRACHRLGADSLVEPARELRLGKGYLRWETQADLRFRPSCSCSTDMDSWAPRRQSRREQMTIAIQITSVWTAIARYNGQK